MDLKQKNMGLLYRKQAQPKRVATTSELKAMCNPKEQATRKWKASITQMSKVSFIVGDSGLCCCVCVCISSAN